MKGKTYIARALEVAGEKARYDERIKKLISDKQILSQILKYSTREFMNYPAEEILECIEGEPEVGIRPVYPGKTTKEAITGLPTQDKVPNEGEVTYDIRFYAVTPEKERIKLIINVEAQKDYYPGYDLVTRGIFYCARMLSAQLDTEFTAGNYDGIKKVYSIWICMDAPKYAAGTITEYTMEQKKLLGDFRGKARYDLLSVVMICLGNEEEERKEEKQEKSLHGLLRTLLSERLPADKKMEILNNRYGIRATVEMKEGMNLMCNLSDRIEEKGIEKGLEEGKKQGESNFAALAAKLLKADRAEDLLKATKDEEFREVLYQELGIK